MKMAYICSPYRSNLEPVVNRNVKYAERLTRWAIDQGYAPITPHLYLPRCLNDDNPVERKQALNVGFELLSMCDIVIVGRKHGISEVMSAEIEEAEVLGIEVVDS